MNWNSIRVFAAALLLAACTAEMPDTAGTPGGRDIPAGPGRSLVVSLPAPVSRTELGAKQDGKYPTVWQEGDRLSLNGYPSHALTAAEAGGTSASFLFKDGLASPFNLLYPATDKADVLDIPYEQHYFEGSFDPAAVPMWGSSLEYEGVTLHHFSSLVRMSVSSPAGKKLKSVSLTAPGGEPLSGSFSLGTDESGCLDGSLSPLEAISSVRYTFGTGGFALGTEARVFYIAVPEGNYSRGFRAVLADTDGGYMILSFFAEGREIAPGKVLEFPAKEFAAGTEDVIYISTAAEFKTLAAASNAVLVDDIDMTGESWTVITNFSGTLDGMGHTLKGLTVPFCSGLSGTVRNLVLASEIRDEVNSSSTLTRGCLANTLGATGRLEGCVFAGTLSYGLVTTSTGSSFVGGLIGTAANGSYIKDCVNIGTVMGDKVSAGAVTMGGIVGRLQSDADGLVNRGVVKFTSTSKASTLYLGGAVGNHNSQGTVSRIKNEGSVLCQASVTNALYMGGCLGANSVGILEGITNSVNASVVLDCSSKNAVGPRVGGIVGHLVLQAHVKDCVNRTPVTVISKGEVHTLLAAGGIAGYYSRDDTNDLTVLLEGCENYADITVKGNFVNKSAAANQQGYLGGIIGCGYLTGTGSHSFTLRGCTNYGNIIIEDNVSYARVGGITGGTNLGASTIERCCNRGNITVGGEATSYSAGGIVSALVAGNTLRYCKNSGDIWGGGLISGTSPVTVAVSSCGVGGRIWNGEAWEAPMATNFAKYIYAGWAPSDYTSYPEYYTGCALWDGSSKLSWEE